MRSPSIQAQNAHRDSFEWPPPQADLDTVRVLSMLGEAVDDRSTAPRPTGRERRHGWTSGTSTRQPRFTRVMISVVAAAALLVVSKAHLRPWLDTAPRTALPASPSRMPSAAPSAANAPRVEVLSRPVPTPTAPARASGGGSALASTRAPYGVESGRSTSPDAALSVERMPSDDLRPMAAAPPLALPPELADRAVVDVGVLDGGSLPVTASDRASLMAAPTVVTPILDREAAAVATARPLVAGVLDRYTDAYGRLDVQATVAVWPSVDTRALERAYGSLRSQHLALADCAVSLTPDTALLTCPGTVHYETRVGGAAARTLRGQWRIAMARQGPAWRITSVQTR